MRSSVAVWAAVTCVTGATVAQAANGTVYVSRDEAFVGALMSSSVAVDGAVAGSVDNGGCLKISVPAGKRVIGSPSGLFGTVRESATVNVPSGGQVYIKAIRKMEWPGPVHWTAMVVTPKGRRC